MPKLLLIDDKSDNLTSLAATILSFIPESIIFKSLSGEEGINLAIKELPDVILLDVRMPNMDGFETLDILKSNLKTKIIPVILITANYTDPISKSRGLECGADSFLTKPIDSNELIAQIKVMLRIKFAEDKLRGEKDKLEILVNERTTSLRNEIEIRKQKEKELKESEEKFRNIFETANEGICLTNKSGEIILVNKKFADLVGYSINEVIGKSFTIFIIEEELPEYRERQKERQIGIKEVYDRRLKRKDGILIWTTVSASPILDDKNTFNGSFGMFTDITKRKIAEENLITTSEFNQSLINTIPFGLDIVDLDGNILFMNNLLKDVIGIENPKGKCWELYKDNGEQCIECPLKSNLELGETNICEVHSVLGGREFEVTHTVMNFKAKKALLEVFRDITEEKIADKKIRQLSLGIEQSSEMIIITDFEGIITYINPRVSEVTGYSSDELLGKNASIMQSGNTSKEIYMSLWRSILKGKVWKGKLLNKRKNGEKYWESLSISPIIEENGDIFNFIAIKEDITEKMAAMEEMMEAKEKAEQSEKMKTEFLSQMSHEIRTPLNIIASNSSLLREDLDQFLDEDTRYSFDSINTASKRIIRTVDLIINMSDIQTGSFEIFRSKFDIVSQIIKPVVIEYSIYAERKNIAFSFNTDLVETTLTSDEHSVNFIINNLVDNAIKFTSVGKVKASLYRNEQNRLVFEISDTGIGMSEDYIDNMMYRNFTQEEHGYSRKYDGNGLGLAIAKKYCEFLNFELIVKSKKNVGSTFKIIF